jgi:caa(3)-type oxidase subunit IV
MSEHAENNDSHYVKIWAILLALLLISFVGPFAGIQWLTLLTAFGIAIVKAYLVAVNFMHINMTPRFVIYLVTTTLVFMLLFFAGTAPDVMQSSGTNWIKPAWIEAERAFEAGEVSGLGSHGSEQDSELGGEHGTEEGH